MKSIPFVLVALGEALASNAAADEYMDEPSRPRIYDYAWSEPSMASRIGVAIAVGGGISGFTDPEMRDASESDLGGMWGARLTIGSHIPVGVDLSYTGTSVELAPLGGASTGTLVGTTIESALRWNMLPHYHWNPYVFGGVGWQRYDVRNVEDDLVVVPMGGGLSWRDPSGLAIDVRGTFRLADTSTLLVDTTGERTDLHTWDAGATVGYEL